ncbi:hypothetical protein [Brevibacillus reuszeri]|uniref:hypothetical protein n=1 Tax=Brevibacillus reuszeri TaxID=54915 RepID=UPI000CCBE3AB|nr:hypothetical protein [Brevibacillus reuszeri]
MKSFVWNLWDDTEHFELGDSGARPGVWREQKALFLEKINVPVFLREPLPFDRFRLQAEVSIPRQVGFVGLVFGALDSQNYELVYLAPEEIQYDPIMNGCMTWQIYNGSRYQKPYSYKTGEWLKLSVEVHPEGAFVYVGEDPVPQLALPTLQHGGSPGKIGFWGYLPAYIRNLSVEEIPPRPIAEADAVTSLSADLVTAWVVSEPYASSSSEPKAIEQGKEVRTEENGILNINRLYEARQGLSIQAQSTVTCAAATESLLSIGFSDQLRLWVNEEEVYQGEWRWSPPSSDGRIRSNHATIPVRWRAGVNTIRAELTNQEVFGWGICVRTGLSKEQLL